MQRSRTTTHVERLRDLGLAVPVEHVPGDVELGGSALEHGVVEAAVGELGHPLGGNDVGLVLGDLGEHRKLVRFLD